jgi:hypothetical protein
MKFINYIFLSVLGLAAIANADNSISGATPINNAPPVSSAAPINNEVPVNGIPSTPVATLVPTTGASSVATPTNTTQSQMKHPTLAAVDHFYANSMTGSAVMAAPTNASPAKTSTSLLALRGSGPSGQWFRSQRQIEVIQAREHDGSLSADTAQVLRNEIKTIRIHYGIQDGADEAKLAPDLHLQFRHDLDLEADKIRQELEKS